VRMRRLATRSVMVLAVCMLLAGMAGGVTPLAAAAAKTGSSGQSAAFSASGGLRGVAATSATNAWTVGYTGNKSLIVHWNGKTWRQVPSPGGAFYGVAVPSASVPGRSAPPQRARP
jgi:hypothetical protein